jgi:hypothetical protein
MLALFRASTERFVGEPWFKALVADLQLRSSEFRAWWSHHDLQIAHTGPIELNHPPDKWVVLQPTTLQVVNAPDLRMTIYTPLSRKQIPRKSWHNWRNRERSRLQTGNALYCVGEKTDKRREKLMEARRESISHSPRALSRRVDLFS